MHDLRHHTRCGNETYGRPHSPLPEEPGEIETQTTQAADPQEAAATEKTAGIASMFTTMIHDGISQRGLLWMPLIQHDNDSRILFQRRPTQNSPLRSAPDPTTPNYKAPAKEVGVLLRNTSF